MCDPGIYMYQVTPNYSRVSRRGGLVSLYLDGINATVSDCQDGIWSNYNVDYQEYADIETENLYHLGRCNNTDSITKIRDGKVNYTTLDNDPRVYLILDIDLDPGYVIDGNVHIYWNVQPYTGSNADEFEADGEISVSINEEAPYDSTFILRNGATPVDKSTGLGPAYLLVWFNVRRN